MLNRLQPRLSGVGSTHTWPLANGGVAYHFETGPFNWYVLAEGGRLTLVDAGFPGHYRVFRDGIASLGFTVKDVAAVLLTHAHADHMGFAERLRRESGAPVFVHGEDLAAAQRPLQLPWFGLLSNAWRTNVAGMLGHAIVNGVFTMPRIAKVHPLRDGQILDVPGRPVVIHAPGHTPGEAAFFLPEPQVLLSGDALITRNLLTGAHGGPQLASPALTHDMAAARRTLDRFRELGSLTLLPGHGKAWQGSLATLDRL
jgi:glyoxylase-like metal-dependent hydrolase (beta-lactamase superfamily II)